MIFQKMLTHHLSQARSRGTWTITIAVTDFWHLSSSTRWSTSVSSKRMIYLTWETVAFEVFAISCSHTAKQTSLWMNVRKLARRTSLESFRGYGKTVRLHYAIHFVLKWGAWLYTGKYKNPMQSNEKCLALKLMNVTSQRYTNIEYSQAVWESQRTRCVRH